MLDTKNNKISVGIINLEFHNLFSIYHAVKSLGYNVKVFNLKQKNYNSDILILPGVGSFNFAMKKIKSNNIDNNIKEYLEKKKLLFGICLGMQLLFEESNEFTITKGMGLIKGNVEKFSNKKFKVPHIGWERIIKTRNTNLLNVNDHYYFVHSMYCKPQNKKTTLSLTNYQGFSYCSSIHVKNIFATQFHPEKSGLSGLKILNNMKKLI
jgi:imidazole glycerol-phosphate synthase subunit HisH